MTIYLVRHGLALSGVGDLDPGLAELGHRQAEAAATALAASNARRLIVSPLRRTRETAAPIARVLGLEPEIRDEVAEVFESSMPGAERRAMIGPLMAGRWAGQPAQLIAWRRRVVDTVLELGLLAAAANEDLIVVSHYIAISVIIGEATDDDRVVPVALANASITTLTAGHGGITLLKAAATDHLSAELLSSTITGTAPANRSH